MKNKILLDIDGVLADFHKGFSQFLNENYDTNIDLNVEPNEYSLDLWGHNLSKEETSAAIPKWIISEGYKKIPIYSGASDFVRRLQEKYDVRVMTARVGDFTDLSKPIINIIKNDTFQWFKNNNISSDIVFGNKKIEYCKLNKISIIIEDKLETVVDAANKGMKSILFDRGWNRGKGRDHPNIHVVYNYDDILNALEKLVE